MGEDRDFDDKAAENWLKYAALMRCLSQHVQIVKLTIAAVHVVFYITSRIQHLRRGALSHGTCGGLLGEARQE